MKKLIAHIILTMLSFSSFAGFNELHMKPVKGVVEIEQAVSGNDYLCFLALNKKKAAIKKVTSNCACLEILKVPEIKDERYESVLLFKPLRNGPFAIKLSVEYSDKSTDTIILKGKVTAGRVSGQAVPPALLERKLQSIDAKLYASARQAVHDKNAFIIDIRSKSAFSGLTIDRARQMAPFVIKTQDWLKNKSVYLLDDGIYKISTEQHCSRLRSSGFKKAYIIQGGLAAWKSAGGKFNKADSQIKLNKVDPLSLILSKNLKQVVLINDLIDESKLSSLIPWAVSSAKITKLNSSLQYIVVSDKSKHSLKGDNVFHIEGGFDGVEKVLKQFTARLNKGSVTSKKKKCGNCPQ